MAINWQEVVTTTFTSVGGGVVFLGAAAWLMRTVISAGLAREADAFKMKLKADADTEIERLKSALQIAAVEHQVRFSKLHERRATVIENLYGRLVEAHKNARHFALAEGYSGDKQKQDDAYVKIEREMDELYDFIETHRIYLPDQFCVELEALLRTMRGQIVAVSIYGSVGDNPTPQVLEERLATFREAYKTFDEVGVPALKRSLEHEFRKILGVENPTSPGSSA
jgi:hypothetical protein